MLKLCLVMGMVFGSILLRAQTLNSSPRTQPVQGESIVQMAAESQGLQVVSSDQGIPSGTFWWVLTGGSAVPMPCPPNDLSRAIYQIVDSQYLVDVTDAQAPALNSMRRSGLQTRSDTSGTMASQLSAQADQLAALIVQIQTTSGNLQMRAAMQTMDTGVPSPGGEGGGGSGSDSFTFSSAYTLNTNGLWLEITGVTNGLSRLNLHNATK